MLEYIVYLVFSLIGGSIGLIGAYAIAKRAVTTDTILNLLDDLSDEIMTNENLQKKIYAIGALVGKGIIDGTGLKSTTKRKRGFQDIIMEIAGQWIQGRFMQPEQTAQQPTSPELT